MSATFGRMSPQPFAYYDPDTCSVRTSQATFPWDSTPSSPTLPPWGSMSGGELYERPTPAPLTAARDCSSSLLLPTSRATDGEKGGPNQVNGRGVRDSLPGLAPTLLPTPTSRDHKGRIQRDDQTCLPGALLPTPAVNDMGRGKTVEDWDEWTDRMRAEHGNGNGHGKSLEIEALRLLPTPTAADQHPARKTPRKDGKPGDTDMIRQVAVLHLSAPTPPPSPAGNTSSDDQPPLPLNPAATGDHD